MKQPAPLPFLPPQSHRERPRYPKRVDPRELVRCWCSVCRAPVFVRKADHDARSRTWRPLCREHHELHGRPPVDDHATDPATN